MIAVSRNCDTSFFASLNQGRACLYRNFFAIDCELDFSGLPGRGGKGSVAGESGSGLRARGGANELRPHLDGRTGLS